MSDDAKDGWLPIVLCPTDGVFRMVRLPDGTEVAAAFDGGSGVGVSIGAARRWQTKEFFFHTPAKPTGEVYGGVPVIAAAYDTTITRDLPVGVYPTHFRPNDTVMGPPRYLPPKAVT